MKSKIHYHFNLYQKVYLLKINISNIELNFNGTEIYKYNKLIYKCSIT